MKGPYHRWRIVIACLWIVAGAAVTVVLAVYGTNAVLSLAR
jgi:hypothetical protein